MELPSVSEYAMAFFDYLQDEIAKSSPAETVVASKEKNSGSEVDRYELVSSKLVSELSPNEKDLKHLVGIIVSSMYGLGDLDVLMADEWIEEIIINKGDDAVGIYHRKYGWMTTNLFAGTDDDIANLTSKISRRAGRQISVLHPLLDAQLGTGDRVNATLGPISAEGNTLTIRKFSRNPWTIVNLCSGATRALSIEMAAMIWQAIHYGR